MSATDELVFVRAAAGGALALPTVPRVVCRLIEQLRQPEVALRALVDELEQEPVLAAHAVRIAGSPLYSGRRDVRGLADAIAVIGIDALRTLVICEGMKGVFVEVAGVNMRQFWAGASLASQAARGLARLAGAEADAAYLAGLLHEVGHLILCQSFPALAPRLAGVRAPRGRALAALEAEVCGVSHPRVGAAWLRELGFPSDIVAATALHLEPGVAPGGLAALVALASRLARALQAGDDLPTIVREFDLALWPAGLPVGDDLARVLEDLCRSIGDAA